MLFPPPTPSGNPPRVAVTGAGIIAALGAAWQVNATGLREDQPASRPVTRFDTGRQRARKAAVGRAKTHAGRAIPTIGRSLDHSRGTTIKQPQDGIPKKQHP